MYASEKMFWWFHTYETITTQESSHTTGLHNKCQLNNIQQYMMNLKKLVFLFDALLSNSTKFFPGQVIEQTIIKDKNLQVYKSAFKMHPLSELVFDIRFRKTINILYNNIFVLWFKVIILFMGVIS